VNVIAFFRNAVIVLHLKSTGTAVSNVDEHQFRCLPHHFEAPIAAIEVPQHDGVSMKSTISQNLLPQFWLQILEQEAAQMLGEDEQ
jgi:hypothetical protein